MQERHPHPPTDQELDELRGLARAQVGKHTVEGVILEQLGSSRHLETATRLKLQNPSSSADSIEGGGNA